MAETKKTPGEPGSKGPVVKQRVRIEPHEPAVRTAGVWGVALDFTRSLYHENPRPPEFDRNALPPYVFVAGRKEPLMVYACFTFLRKDEEQRRWTVSAEIFPRIKDAAVLRKIEERFDNLKSYLAMLANDKADPPEVGSQVFGYRYMRPTEEVGDLDTEDLFFLNFDWSAGRRQRRAQLIAERETARFEAEQMRATPASPIARHVWIAGGLVGLTAGAFTGSLLGGIACIAVGAGIGWLLQPKSVPELVPVDEAENPDIVVPEIDPWEARFIEFNADKRAPGVERLFHSLFSMLVVQEGNGEEVLRAAGLGRAFHKTTVADPEAPISTKLWGKGNRTVVIR